jgi:hypothetical protein
MRQVQKITGDSGLVPERSRVGRMRYLSQTHRSNGKALKKNLRITSQLGAILHPSSYVVLASVNESLTHGCQRNNVD